MIYELRKFYLFFKKAKSTNQKKIKKTTNEFITKKNKKRKIYMDPAF